MTLKKAIDKLKKEYGRAKTSNHVRDPLAWALYQVWKAVDAEHREQYEYPNDAVPQGKTELHKESDVSKF